MPQGPNKVVPTSREVIEGRLLAALDDNTKVAILASVEDLDLFICAFKTSEGLGMALEPKLKEMRLSLEQLRREAFGL